MASTAEDSPLSRPFAPALAARGAVVVLAGSLLIAACAHIAVPLPFTPVPMTLQPFAVVLLGLLLGPSLGAATCAAYLLEGAVGLPVFTPQGPGGIPQLLGLTGGYLLSYPAAAAVAGALSRLSFGGRARRGFGTGFGRALLGAAAANLLILSAGACRFGMLTHGAPSLVYQTAVLPFLGEDALKVVLAALIATGWQRYRARFDQTHKPDPA